MSYQQASLEPMREWLTDPDMVEIAVNPNGKIWILRRGDVAMLDTGEAIEGGGVTKIIQLIAGGSKAHISKEKLLLSASTSFENRPIRVQGVISPAAHGDAALSLRMFSSTNIDEITLKYLSGSSQSAKEKEQKKLAELDHSIKNNTLMETLQLCVDQKFNVLISGGTDTGKTVTLRKVLSLINKNDRIITIEDAMELFPTQPNCVSLIADRASEARSTEKLLEASLRMRPDRLLVGEIRGKEAMTFLEAINTGHGGSMSTIHAESPELALDRLAIAAARSGVPMSYDNLREYINRTIDVIIHTGRNGSQRGVTEIYSPKTNRG